MNDLKIFSGRANRELTKRICDKFGWAIALESTATGTVARVTF